MAIVDVGSAEDWKPGDRRSVKVQARVICVVRTPNAYYAINDTCPHQGASLCKGTVGGTMVSSSPQQYEYGLLDCVIRCPWHGWEFDLRSGASLFDPQRIRVRTYPVSVVDDRVVILV
jgi:3-phenylpropionate/trans-cinnamate dioxygenase ferredoxin subunit